MRQKMGHSAKFLHFFETAFKHLIYYTFKKKFPFFEKKITKNDTLLNLFFLILP